MKEVSTKPEYMLYSAHPTVLSPNSMGLAAGCGYPAHAAQHQKDELDQEAPLAPP